MDTTPYTYDFLSRAPPDTRVLEQEASTPSHAPTLTAGQPAMGNTTQANLGTQAAPGQPLLLWVPLVQPLSTVVEAWARIPLNALAKVH